MASSTGTPPQESTDNSLKLTQLPVKFLEKLINQLDVVDWLIVRNVSHGFRKLIDESEAVFSNVTVQLRQEDTEIHIGNQKILYPFRLTRITVPYLPDMQVLMKFLTNFKIQKFEVKTESEPEVFTEFVDLLDSLALKIRAKKFFYSTEHPDLMIRILQHLNWNELAVLEPIEGMEQRETKMTEHLKSVINNYIHNCAIGKYRVYSSYKLLSEILGNIDLPYVEYEWKYYQHYHGNPDLSIWKSSEEMYDAPEDRTLNAIIPILQILNPETLKEIILCEIEKMDLWKEIQETEQWKKAEILNTYSLPNEFPFEELSHFKKIICTHAEVDTERLVVIRDILTTSANFESLHINIPTLRNLPIKSRSTDKIKRIMSENPMYIPKIGGFLIPNSKDYFRLYMEDKHEDYRFGDGRSNFGIKRIVNKGATVDSEVENDYPNASEISKFILKAALKKEPVFESYKEWDENEENPKIDFLDFEWRYYEFYHGKRDFSIERRPESSLTFNDLTSEVLAKVVEKTDMFHRLVIRKVSRNLREIVDETNANCKEVLLRFGSNHMIFGWEKEYIKYIQAENEDEFKFEVHRVGRFKETEPKELNFSKEEFARMMIADAANFLKTPNLKIGKFVIHTTHDNRPPLISVVVRFLKSLNFKIRAEELNMPYNSPFHKILQYFDPNCLKKLCLKRKLKNNTASNEENEVQNELEKVMKMEIWTKIESFEIDFRLSDDFPIEKFFHFKQITIKWMKMTEMRLVKIRDILLKSPQFEFACFPLDEMKMPMEKNRRETVVLLLKRNPWKFIDGIMSQDAAYDSGTRRFSIPGSEQYYQLEFDYSYGEKLVIRRTLENQNSCQ